MRDLVKEIRSELKLNQEQLAHLLGVSPVTVNRWEHGKSTPSLMAQKQLYERCEMYHLRLADYLIAREQIKNDGLIVFHASRRGIEGSIAPVSRSRCDFGSGFYMGTDPLQPMTLVCNEEKPVFYTLELNLAELKVLHIDADLDWAMLISYFRGYMKGEETSSLYKKYAHMTDGYDVIEGYIPDDRMYQVLTEFFERRITDAALIASLSALNLGRQYVAITKKACEHILVLRERKMEPLELQLLMDKSEIRRHEGKRLAEQMVLQHRRDGRYFDEILRGVEL